jgi:hypothetical protein
VKSERRSHGDGKSETVPLPDYPFRAVETVVRSSHLHHFKVGEQLYGDPMLMEENMEEMDYQDSMMAKELSRQGVEHELITVRDAGRGLARTSTGGTTISAPLRLLLPQPDCSVTVLCIR